MIVHFDCRHYVGYKPCAFRRECGGCPHYAPIGPRILVIKLGAMGDVLRTTPLLRGLKEEYPDCQVTWLTEPNVQPMLKGIPEIDRLLVYSLESVSQLECESFDRLFCFDKEPKATALAMKVRAGHKTGFGLNARGGVMPLDTASEYMFELGINDPLKFRINRKTYPELLFDCAGIPYPGPREYLFPDFTEELECGRRTLESLGAVGGAPKVGLNTGAGDVFATKKWTEEGYAGLADRLVAESGAQVLLLGGPAETERNRRIASMAHHALIDTGTGYSVRDFAGIVGSLDLMVTGDTLALHIAIGLKVPVVLIMGPTCHQEIELYGRGEMIVSDFDCSPCYLSRCPKDFTCMEATSVDAVYAAARRTIASLRSGTSR